MILPKLKCWSGIILNCVLFHMWIEWKKSNFFTYMEENAKFSSCLFTSCGISVYFQILFIIHYIMNIWLFLKVSLSDKIKIVSTLHASKKFSVLQTFLQDSPLGLFYHLWTMIDAFCCRYWHCMKTFWH